MACTIGLKYSKTITTIGPAHGMGINADVRLPCVFHLHPNSRVAMSMKEVITFQSCSSGR